jgi:hypothetical protein
MTKKLCGMALGLVAVAMLAGCGGGPNSLGVIVNDPTGLAFRHQFEADRTLNIAVGLRAFDSDIAHGYVDYIIHFDNISQGEWNPYWGVGVGYRAKLDNTVSNDDVGISLRVPLGLSYQDDGWDFFVQLAAYIDAHPGISGALGVRFDL